MKKIALIGAYFAPICFLPITDLNEEELAPDFKSKYTYGEHKDGRANRRERRKQQRKKK